jgi:hypothetical protein
MSPHKTRQETIPQTIRSSLLPAIFSLPTMFFPGCYRSATPSSLNSTILPDLRPRVKGFPWWLGLQGNQPECEPCSALRGREDRMPVVLARPDRHFESCNRRRPGLRFARPIRLYQRRNGQFRHYRHSRRSEYRSSSVRQQRLVSCTSLSLLRQTIICWAIRHGTRGNQHPHGLPLRYDSRSKYLMVSHFSAVPGQKNRSHI